MPEPTNKSPHDDETNDWRSWIVENGPRLLLCALPGDRNALILTSLRRAAIDKARSHDRRVNREQAHLVIEGDPIEWFNPEPDEREKVVEAAIKLLPHEQREVVTLKIWGDLTFDEIGKQLEISPNTVSSRYRYALAALKKHLAGIRSELSP
jgi:RNA polymerase sigma-70 factor (ECF subfamily)